MTRRWARPYVVTGGRSSGFHRLDTHTQVWASDTAVNIPGLSPHAHALYEAAAGGPISIAELSAGTGIPLGVTRVLVSDGIQAGHVRVAPQTYTPLDPVLLEKVLDGLNAL